MDRVEIWAGGSGDAGVKRRFTDNGINPFRGMMGFGNEGGMSGMSAMSSGDTITSSSPFDTKRSKSILSTPYPQSVSVQGRNRRDLSSIAPLDKLRLANDGNTQLYTVPNGVTNETIVATSGLHSVVIYRLKITEKNETSEEFERPKIKFELEKMIDIFLETDVLGYFALGPECSLILPPNRLIFCISSFQSDSCFYFDFKEENFLPETVYLDNPDCINQDAIRNSLKIFDNGCETRHMAIKNHDYLACSLKNLTIVVWDIKSESKFCVFQIDGHVSHMSWHPSEPYKLFTVLHNGWAKLFNIARQRCFMSFYMCRCPLLCGDWATTNPSTGVVGWSGGYTTFDMSQQNTNLYKCHDIPARVVKRVRFNPMDLKSVATLERGQMPAGTVKLWRDHIPQYIWCHVNDQITDIAWMHGKPFIIALGHQHIFILDASCNS